jgi:hypothetical protein
MRDLISVRRVANGWIIYPGGPNADPEFTHIAASPQEVGAHVEKWAKATQEGALTSPIKKA